MQLASMGSAHKRLCLQRFQPGQRRRVFPGAEGPTQLLQVGWPQLALPLLHAGQQPRLGGQGQGQAQFRQAACPTGKPGQRRRGSRLQA